MNVRLDSETGIQTSFYECRGTKVVQNSGFLSRKPWLIPFCISSFKGTTLDELPTAVDIYQKRYDLGGFTMLKSGHYTGVIMWQGKKNFYDGMAHTDDLRLQPLKAWHYKDQEGSYAYYFLSNCTY